MLKGRNVSILLAALILCTALSGMFRMDVRAEGQKEYLDSLNVGIAQIIEPSSGAAAEKAIDELTRMSEQESPSEEEESDLVMSGKSQARIPIRSACCIRTAAAGSWSAGTAGRG